jgi:hypothetical protein
MAGGTLTPSAYSTLDALNQTGGLLFDLAAAGVTYGSLPQSAGTIEADSGTLALEGTTNSLASAIRGGPPAHSCSTAAPAAPRCNPG